MATKVRNSIEQLVGRSTEIDIVSNAVLSARDGRGAVLLFAGEPGIGKSTLARFGAEMASEQGMAVYWGFSWEAGGAPAYWPWTQSLRSLISDQAVDPEQLAPLVQILPELAAADSSEPELQPDQARFLLLESIRSLLVALAAKTPLVLILEDLHAADSDSLHLLHYLSRHAASLPLLIIGTYRDVEARSSVDTEPLWQTSRNATVLRLPRLDEADIRDYLRLRDGDSPDDAAVHQLLQTTAGNPLFLTELVELLARDSDAASSYRQLPDSVQQVIRQQLALLPPAATSLLACASVFGREFAAPELAAMIGQSESEVLQNLQPAIDADVVRVPQEGRFRFGHALYRDVLYQDLGASSRAEAHLSCAQRLRHLIDEGDVDQWSALARHLQLAGPEYRRAAIDALRHAAARAHGRLAFQDAATLLLQALGALGEGPKYEPVERCRLLVDCGNALLITGEIEAGQQHCQDAFAIAKTIGDATLMSEVALTWGSIILVAKVDRALIAALEECLAALPSEDSATRSRVQARLAGAMQPALNPAIPMDMAREAIALARTTGDDRVLYHVLRFALAALMDFAPPRERIELNREFASMAAARNDVPQLFRSNQLMMIDASELGDRTTLDEAVQACDDLAHRIGLPHYQWRAASARAMQATIDGDFERACELIDVAQSFADKVEDPQASVTPALQRFALLVEWDSPTTTPLEDIEARLQRAYAGGMGEAEFFIAPFIAIYKEGTDAGFAKQFIANEPLVQRTFAGSDRFSLSGLGQMALKAGDLDLAGRCYDALIEYREACSTLGLMGSCWCGPVAYWLGVLAHGLGRLREAREHTDTALDIATRMCARPYIARIHASAAEIARDAGDEARAIEHSNEAIGLMQALGLRPVRVAPAAKTRPTPATPATGLSMRRDGDIWAVEYAGHSATVRDAKGLRMLADLIARPDTDIHVLDLSGAPAAAESGDSGPMLDAKARDEYRNRVRELEEELEEAESLADLGRADSLRSEIDFIARELSRAFGLGGRKRTTGDATERARVNVRRRIMDAVQRIGEQSPEAGRYLENTIKTGRYCKYSPM